MLNLTRRVDYGIVLLTHLGLYPNVPFSARQIATRYRLSPSFTANVLKTLQKGDLVKSQRGVRGGYILCRPPAEICLTHVIQVLEGVWCMVECQMAQTVAAEHAAFFVVDAE
jgi:Rrf2 family protein